MNDLLIISICIFFMILIWGFYFKSVKEGVDNYTMPISFSNNKSTNPTVDKSDTINVPKNIKSNENQLNLQNNTNINGETNMNGHVRLPINTPIEFGSGENKEVNAGKITYGTWHDKGLCIVGGGQYPRQVHVWDDLIVDRDLNVNNVLNVNKELNVNNGGINIKNGHWLNMDGGINTGGMNTNWLNVHHGDTNIYNGHWLKMHGGGGVSTNYLDTNHINIQGKQSIYGIQMGRIPSGSNWYGTVYFPNQFGGDNVFVFTTISDEGGNRLSGCRIFGANRYKFEYQKTGASRGSNYGFDWGGDGTSVNWLAFCV